MAVGLNEIAVLFCCRRRMYWSDCSRPATIQTARVDGGDHQILITDDQNTCIVDIAIDFDSTYIALIATFSTEKQDTR